MMFTHLAGFPAEQIRNFLYDAMLVDPTNNAALDPFGIYNAAINFKVGGREIDDALGWPRGTADEWVRSQGLPALVSGDYTVTTGKYLGDVRDELVNLGILTNRNVLVTERIDDFIDYMDVNNIDALQMELTLGWDIDSIGTGRFPVTPPINYNDNPSRTPESVVPITTSPAPRANTTPSAVTETNIRPIPGTVPGTNTRPAPAPVTRPPVVTVNVPRNTNTSNSNGNSSVVPPAINQTDPVLTEQSQSKLPLLLGIGALLATMFN